MQIRFDGEDLVEVKRKIKVFMDDLCSEEDASIRGKIDAHVPLIDPKDPEEKIKKAMYRPLSIMDGVTYERLPPPKPMPSPEEEAVTEDTFRERVLGKPAPNPIVTADPEIDAAGVRWAPVMHSKNKTRTQRGLWRFRRNMPDTEINMHLKKQGFVKIGEIVQKITHKLLPDDNVSVGTEPHGPLVDHGTNNAMAPPPPPPPPPEPSVKIDLNNPISSNDFVKFTKEILHALTVSQLDGHQFLTADWVEQLLISNFKTTNLQEINEDSLFDLYTRLVEAGILKNG